MNRLRGKLTYANVVATLALFVALAGGTAFAASKMLPRNSVGAKQIKKEAVTPVKLSKASKAALTGQDGPRGATGPQGPKGERGDQGERGEKGERGEVGPSTGPAGGALTGNSPNPDIAPETRGVAMAGVTAAGENPPSIKTWFNRRGGAPTITRVLVGHYQVRFPGISPDVLSNLTVTSSTSSGDVVGVGSGGAAGDRYLQVTLQDYNGN